MSEPYQPTKIGGTGRLTPLGGIAEAVNQPPHQ